MSSGVDDEDAQTFPQDLGALRARLYAPDSTPADRAAYDAAVARAAGRGEAPTDPVTAEARPEVPISDESPGERAAAAPVAALPRRVRPLTVGVLAVALLVVGAGIGVGASSITRGSAAPASTSASPSRPTATDAPPLPTPVAARTLPIPAAARKKTDAALAAAFATDPDGTDETVADEAVQLIATSASGSASDDGWMTRHACSSAVGVVRTSRRGLPVDLTPADRMFDLPAQSHLRITIYLQRAAGWSWIVSAARGTTADAPIAVGAGSPEAGTVQYADFDGAGSGNLTRVRIASTGGTPFLWKLDSCITGA